MNENSAQELFAIRETQGDLRRRLDALDLRISRIADEVKSKEPPHLPERTARPFMPPTGELLSTRPKEPEKPIASSKKRPAFDDESQSTPPAPAVKAPLKPETIEAEAFELRVGRVWLVRVGILILLTGIVFLGNFAWTQFIVKVGAPGKLATILLAGAGLAGLGWWVKRKREELTAYGKVLIGGGIATIYYATYAAHFVEGLRVITSPMLGGVLLMALAGIILWLANRMRSQLVAAVTVLLGFYTAAINPIEGFSLFSNLVLSVIAIVLLVRRQWLSVSILSMVGCYGAFAFWSIQNTGWFFALTVHDVSTFWTALLFPTCYWVVFTVAAFVALAETFPARARASFVTINNGGLFAFTAPLVATTYPEQIWGYALTGGLVLLGLSRLAVWRDAEDKAFDGTYLTQGLVLISLGFLFKFSGYQLAVIFAVQSAALLSLSRFRHGKILQLFSGLSALVATAVALAGLVAGKPHALLTSACVAAILCGVGWIFKAQRGLLVVLSFQWRAAAYAGLGIVLTIAAVVHGASGPQELYWLAGLATVLTLSIHILRMPEVVAGAQVLALVAVSRWCGGMTGEDRSMSSLLVMLFLMGALMHWWARQRILPIAREWRITLEALYAGGWTMIYLLWTVLRFSGTDRLWMLMFGALAMLGYGFLTRTWPLVVGSQVVGWFGAGVLVMAVGDQEDWRFMTGMLVVFASQSLFLDRFAYRAHQEAGAYISPYSVLLRLAASVIGLYILQAYIPESWLFLVFSSVAFGMFLIGLCKGAEECFVYAAISISMATWYFMGRNLLSDEVFSSDLIGIVLVLAAQQIGKRVSSRADIFSREVQGVLAVGGLLAAWLVTGRLVAQVEDGFLLTVAWSLFGLLVLAAGLLLREKIYRWMALGVLTLTVGRLFFFDVWQFDTIYRILSFLVLGGVLLALGFLYNRFADLIRRWI